MDASSAFHVHGRSRRLLTTPLALSPPESQSSSLDVAGTLARLGVKPDWKVLPAFSGAEICRVRSCGARFVINFASGGAGVWLQQRKKIACPASLAGFPARNRSSAWSPRCLVETFVGVSQRCGIPPILPVFLISGAGLSWPPIHRNER